MASRLRGRPPLEDVRDHEGGAFLGEARPRRPGRCRCPRRSPRPPCRPARPSPTPLARRCRHMFICPHDGHVRSVRPGYLGGWALLTNSKLSCGTRSHRRLAGHPRPTRLLGGPPPRRLGTCRHREPVLFSAARRQRRARSLPRRSRSQWMQDHVVGDGPAPPSWPTADSASPYFLCASQGDGPPRRARSERCARKSCGAPPIRPRGRLRPRRVCQAAIPGRRRTHGHSA